MQTHFRYLINLTCVVALTLLISACSSTGPAEQKSYGHGFSVAGSGWWNIPYPGTFNDLEGIALKPQDRIKIEGNKFVDESGKEFIFRGVNIGDPDRLVTINQWNENLFKVVHDWGSNTVRIPIHPIAWRGKGKQFYFDRLDEAVVWANKYDLYIIIDWHSIGNIEDELFQHPMYITSVSETSNFWKDVSHRYKGVPTMAVYEIFNEPTDNYVGTATGLGTVEWEDWLVFLETQIDLIASYDSEVIPLVAGFNWAYDLTPFADNPVRREKVAYAVHPYPMKADPEEKTTENYYQAWQADWGFMAEKYPIIATELGWVAEDGYGAHVPVIDDGSYGPRIHDFMQQRGISWTAWCFDPEWSPVLITDWNFTPSEQGEFFRKVMLEAKAAN